MTVNKRSEMLWICECACATTIRVPMLTLSTQFSDKRNSNCLFTQNDFGVYLQSTLVKLYPPIL